VKGRERMGLGLNIYKKNIAPNEPNFRLFIPKIYFFPLKKRKPYMLVIALTG
jgi:hypothetical protein